MSCSTSDPKQNQHTEHDDHRQNVRDTYAKVAQADNADACCGVESSCCGVSDDVSINTLISTRLGYSEDDIKEASRAFTGWTIAPKLPRQPLGRFPWGFHYKPEDHDEGDKTFLGHTGNFNGDDIIDIIVKQPAAARFISRHLYNFFVEDDHRTGCIHFHRRFIERRFVRFGIEGNV